MLLYRHISGATVRYSSKLVRSGPLLWIIFLTSISIGVSGQTVQDSSSYLTLGNCIAYAMKHQPVLHQAYLKMDIAKASNAINVAGWYPQVAVSGGITHYLKLPTSFVNNASTGNVPVAQTTGVINSSAEGLAVTQALFSPTLLTAVKSAPLFTRQARQVTDSTKIGLVVNVTKAFYNLLLTLEQIEVLKGDTIRLGQSTRDAYHQYIGGIVDETDYKQAFISLNNSTAQLRLAVENVRPQYATLKQLMGYPPRENFHIVFDTTELMQNINIDTTAQLQFEKRIEYQLLSTSMDLQRQVTRSYQLEALPVVSAFYNYNADFYNKSFSKLYNTAYTNSFLGVSLTIPVFTGFARLQNIKKSRLMEQVLESQTTDLKSQIYTEYTTALAGYKGYRYSLQLMQDNLQMAQRVYFVVNLQYKQGIVPYLNVITAESNLITAETGYLNALLQLLSSKVDLQKAMGNISY
ncbi:TolC family protein [Chitinophaga flava]|uniref:TolC family protein n=1 Tax=Chitinophaga flava TaxID=2259036 RepID=UPI0011BE67A7|nr:TolC family protein [Chitinophaga flava]